MQQQVLNGFLGVSFGTTLSSAKQLLLNRPGSVFDEENSNQSALYFDGVIFGGKETSFVSLHFYQDSFCLATVYLKHNLQAKTVELYEEIKQEINNKYFVSGSDYEYYTSPFEKDDGHIETAISLGKANFSCYWKFEKAGGEDDYISISINENFYIVISYENGLLNGLRVNAIKDANSLDY